MVKLVGKSYFSGLVMALILVVFLVATRQLTVRPDQSVTPQASDRQATNQASELKTSPRLSYLTYPGQGDYYLKDYRPESNTIDRLATVQFNQPPVASIGIGPDQSIFLLLASQDEFTGSVVKLTPVGTITSLIPLLRFTSSPKMSANKSALLYVVFSNAEKDFGFKLVERPFDRPEKVLLSNPAGLLLPQSCFEEQICYIRKSDRHNELVKYDPTDQSDELLLVTDQPVVDLTISANHVALIDQAQTDRIVMVEEKSVIVIDHSAAFKRSLKLSADGQWLSWLELSSPTDKTGRLIVYHRPANRRTTADESVVLNNGWY